MFAVWWALFAAVAAEPSAVLDRVEALRGHDALRRVDAPPVPEDAWPRIARGEVVTGLQAVTGHAARKAWGVGLVEVPLERLWLAVNDELDHPGYTAITHAELIEGRACQSGRAVLQAMPLPLASDRWWITEFVVNEAIAAASGGAVRELAWTSSVDPARVTSARGRAVVRSHTPVGFTRGGWLLRRIDAETTLVRYDLWSDPGGRLPAGLVSRLAAGGIEDTLRAVERFATEGRPSCPPVPSDP